MTKVVIAVAAIGLFFSSVAAAQQPGHHNMPMPTPSATPQPAPGACGADDAKPGTPGTAMGCGGCSMMRGMMSSAPTGMMAAAPDDSPKVIQLRGEMMKAMGEVMVKYGKMMEGAR